MHIRINQKDTYNSYHHHRCFGAAVDGEGGVHVGGGEGAGVVAYVGFVEALAEIVVRASETAAEDSGKGGFGPAGVGAGVLGSVAEHEPPQAGTSCDKYHQQCSEACGDVVGHVVYARGPSAELEIALGVIAYHRVEGIDHLVGEHTGDTEQHIVEQRGYHPVREVFGQCLEGGGAHLAVGEGSGVAPYDASHLTAPLVERAVGGFEHHAYLAAQGRPGEAIEYDDGLEQYPGHGPRGEQPDNGPSDSGGRGDEADGCEGTLEDAVRGMVERVFAQADGPSEPYDGVGEPLGVAEQEVENPSEQQGQYHERESDIHLSIWLMSCLSD